MLINLLTIIIGCAVLAWSADKLVYGSVALAKNLGVAPIIIGLTILALGTSFPEIVVSILASLSNNGELAIGNALGSNIANIGLVIGLCAMVKPLVLEHATMKIELALLAVVSVLISLSIWLLGLQLITGIMMLAISIGFVLWLVYRGAQSRDPKDEIKLPEVDSAKASTLMSITWIVVGLSLLLVSARMLIVGAVGLATALGVPEIIIGLTVIAVGTSLPELASSLAALKQGENELVIGNIIGSNIFNLTAVLCPPALIQPMVVQPRVITQDVSCMLLLTALLILMVCRKKSSQMGFKSGLLLLILYGIYIGSLTIKL